MRVTVTHGIDDLERDLKKISTRAAKDMRKVVRDATRVGNVVARDYARARSGPHGKNYFKRITWEMLGPLEGEYGPTGVVENNAVGAGWRHGVNTDLPKSADLIGPSFAQEVREAASEWFW